MSFSWEHGEAIIPLGANLYVCLHPAGVGRCSLEQCHRVIDRNFKENCHAKNLIQRVNYSTSVCVWEFCLPTWRA